MNYQKLEFTPRLLIGHSLGGAAVLQTAEHLPNIEGIVTIGAPCNPEHVAYLFERAEEEILDTGEAKVILAAGHGERIYNIFLSLAFIKKTGSTDYFVVEKEYSC